MAKTYIKYNAYLRSAAYRSSAPPSEVSGIFSLLQSRGGIRFVPVKFKFYTRLHFLLNMHTLDLQDLLLAGVPDRLLR